jgi:serine-type D-Ala-D-Ala carboxypeptidase (penicillin-binding protein 5/6)
LKRFVILCLAFLIALVSFPVIVLASPPEYGGKINTTVSAMLIDADSGKVLFEKNADDQVRPASTTKIMTCIVAIENTPDLSITVKIPSEGDWSRRGGDPSLLNLRKNDKMSMLDLLTGMMLKSGDDAADAVAVLVGGSVSGFVDIMNQKAEELGMTSSHFADAGGLDKGEPYITARDMAKLAVYAMKNDVFRSIVGKASYDMPIKRIGTVKNTNALLNIAKGDYYKYATGIKTGSTPGAGGCLVSSASKDGMNLICLYFGDKTRSGSMSYIKRFPDSRALFEWGFKNWKTVKLSELLVNTKLVQIQVEDYAADDIGKGVLEFAAPDTDNIYVTLPKSTVGDILNGADTIEISQELKGGAIKAPVHKGDILGEVTYKSKETGEEIYAQSLIAPRDVTEEGGSEAPVTTTLQPTQPVKITRPSDKEIAWLISYNLMFWLS